MDIYILSVLALMFEVYIAMGDSLLCSVLQPYNISQFECKHGELVPIIGASGSHTSDSGLFVCEIIIPYDPEKDECKDGAIMPLNLEEDITKAAADFIPNELKIAPTTSAENMGTSPNSDILIGGVIGGVAVMVIIGISILCYRRQRQNRKETGDSSDSVEKETWV